MDWDHAASRLLTALADASVRAVALGAMVAILTLFLRKRAAAEHAMWTGVLVGMLALPWLRPVVPAAHVAMPQRPGPRAQALTQDPVDLPVSSRSAPAGPASRVAAPRSVRLEWPLYAAAAYIAGALLFILRLLVGIVLSRRVLRSSQPIASELYQHDDLLADVGVYVQVEESDRVRVPLTTGWQHARVLLPIEWRLWTNETLREVLAHELAHVRRRDSLVALTAAINKCVFWFHPLAWWLERRLAVLAEHAADDAVLASFRSPKSYARVILDFASRIEKDKGRLIWHAAAMSGPVVAQRIRRVTASDALIRAKRLGGMAGAAVWSSVAVLIWLSTAVEFQSPVQAQVNPLPPPPSAFTYWGYRSNGGWPDSTTAAQAAAMERQLASNPEDEATRARLLRYYFEKGMQDQRARLVLWLIEHRPESALHGYETASLFPRARTNNPADFAEAKRLWLAQVNQHPNDPRVLGNASRALGADSLRDQIDLLQRAQKLDPAAMTQSLAMLQAMVLGATAERNPSSRNPFHNPMLAAQIRSELLASNDVGLVGAVARQLVQQSTQRALERHRSWDFGALKRLSEELVTQARALDPENRDWSDLMEGVRRIPEVVQGETMKPSAAESNKPKVIRVGGGVMPQMLLESPALVYPPEAQAERLQGVVKFQVRIDTTGHVTEATVLSGHPLLIQPATEAVRRYVYKPTLFDGSPVEVLTTVDVPFGQ